VRHGNDDAVDDAVAVWLAEISIVDHDDDDAAAVVAVADFEDIDDVSMWWTAMERRQPLTKKVRSSMTGHC
jgi:hypothetical protein